MRSKINEKIIACFFLLIFSIQTFCPLQVFALTSGPGSPEMKAFEPASTSNMVDLFSGDLNYNIPLLDVGGYPVNLAYQAGMNTEDEASWVGFGWTLNPGAINRTLRGIPDDFNGDEMKQEDNIKPNTTIGGNLNVSIKLFGFRLPKLKRKKMNAGMKVKIGIAYNNYTGYKGMVGIGTAFNTTDENSDQNTKGLGLSASMGLNVDNQSGINPYANYDINYKIKSKKLNEAEAEYAKATKQFGNALVSAIIGCGTVTPEELTNKRQSMMKAKNNLAGERAGGNISSFGSSSSIDFGGFQAPPLVKTPMVSKNFTASLGLGVTLFGGTVVPGLEGTYSKQELKSKDNTAPAYGFPNSHAARTNEAALLDYNMEKDGPYMKRLPNLGVTVFTPDLYNVTSNAGSLQFRPYLRGAGIFFQPHRYDADKSTDIGIEPAAGNLVHFGVPLQLNKTNNISGKWKSRNDFLFGGDFRGTDNAHPDEQAFYLKRVGEKNEQDDEYFSRIGNTAPVAVRLNNDFNATLIGNGTAMNRLRVKNNPDITSVNAVKTKRDKAGNSIVYLTAAEAKLYALDKGIPNYKMNELPTDPENIVFLDRITADRKAHHISQYTITQSDGQRMVYGVPVYNHLQVDANFAVNNQSVSGKIKQYQPNVDNNKFANNNGKDNLVNKKIFPSYSTGHLLSAILSPDYVDVTGNGVSDDDLGTAVKFNYSLVTADAERKLPDYFKWRTPYTTSFADNLNTANYNEGYKSIDDDDKANYSYGEKELWYAHSIESKTMVAVFITADREDGLGVNDENGGRNLNLRLKKLKEIRLFSKADLARDPVAAVPVKTVHFEYYGETAGDDDFMNNVPNHLSYKGKLALKKVWFTYGKNQKGKYHAYEFKYNLPANQDFQEHQTDRWGTYKPASSLPPGSGLDNLEFPYAVQDQQKANENVAAWQLKEISLPSGGTITIDYESDDYAYVQDRKATQMCFIRGMGGVNATSGFKNSDKLYVTLPEEVTAAELEQRYFSGLKSLAFRSFIDLDGNNHYEYVDGYADISSKQLVDEQGNPAASGHIVEIGLPLFKNKYNPISKAAWQKLKLELPRYAYPEYDNIDAEGSGFIKAIKALAATFGRFGDLTESFDERADRKGFGNKINTARSWVRLNTPVGIKNPATNEVKIKGKLGGGHRVKRIMMHDNWSAVSGVPNAVNASYGQEYDYTTTNAAGEVISSGVASYEPMAGGDENPFREPINYADKNFYTQPKFFYLERPMGEAYFPGPSVGYSKVTVKSIGADGKKGEDGSSVHEFYTAKDFPTRVDELTMERRQPKLNFLPRLFGAKITSAVTVSQGYVVENNDMHGRPKAEAVYGKNGNELSAGHYYYKVVDEKAERLQLDNKVRVADKDGKLGDATVGMDIDMFTEMNESLVENMGVSVDPSFGFALPFKFSIRLPWPQPNYEKRLYRGSTTIKLVNRYAILHKVVKTVNGATNVSENLLWDKETGEVLLSKTNNEYKQDIYTLNYPAHWMYEGMGPAFKNEGVYLSSFSTDLVIKGRVVNNYSGLLTAGDELISLDGINTYWLMKKDNDLFVIDNSGKVQELANANLKILRSGRRNLAVASVGTVISMENPATGTELDISYAKKILDAKMVTYNEYWHMPVKGVPVISDKENPDEQSCNCYQQVMSYLLNTNQLFTPAPGIDMNTLLNAAVPNYQVGDCPQFEQNHVPGRYYAITNQRYGRYFVAQMGATQIGIWQQAGNPVVFEDLQANGCMELTAPGNPAQPYLCVNPAYGNYGCDDEMNIVNPYTTGMLGNWRVKSHKIFDTKREQTPPGDPTSTDIKNNGYYSEFEPYWTYNPGSNSWDTSTLDKWRWTSMTRKFNLKGQETENMDALHRFSSAQFGYLQSLPVAVGSNAMQREIAYDGFEDYDFGLQVNGLNDCSPIEQLGIRNVLTSSTAIVVNTVAHTGKYSLKLISGVHLTDKAILQDEPETIHQFNSDNEFELTSSYMNEGFSPKPDKKYIISGWVYDGDATTNTINNFSLIINGVTYDVNDNVGDPAAIGKVHVVEGWKRFHVVFQTGSSGDFDLYLGGSNIYLDDLRISPNEGQLKTFAYNDRNLRLMAELDENNFATFYEYDDEGTLIRVKKETEKGIKTIKESRSSTRRKP